MMVSQCMYTSKSAVRAVDMHEDLGADFMPLHVGNVSYVNWLLEREEVHFIPFVLGIIYPSPSDCSYAIHGSYLIKC